MSYPILNSMLERRRFGMKPGLETMQALMERLGHPESELAVLHIAGTDGKGAAAALCESVLRAAGYSVGRYTSPHLVALNERFLVNGLPADDASLEAAAAEVSPAIGAVETEAGREVTFFECLTAVAFVLFRQKGIRLAVIETGLGGRLDATNVVTPLLSLITRIGLDHCEWLGETVAKIAAEKAGIIKPGRPVVCGAMPPEAREVVFATAARLKAPCTDAADSVCIRVSKSGLEGQTLSISTQNRSLPPVRLPLAGAFQAENAANALAALEGVVDAGLAISDEAFVQGLEGVCWPGRFQLACTEPSVIVDGAHNPCAAEALRAALKSCHVKKPLGLVAGFCGDKDALGFLQTLRPVLKRAWSVAIPNPRSLSADRAAGIMRMAGLETVTACPGLPEALTAAQAWAVENDGLVLVCGSLFLAGEALVALHAFPWTFNRVDPNERLTPLSCP